MGSFIWRQYSFLKHLFSHGVKKLSIFRTWGRFICSFQNDEILGKGGKMSEVSVDTCLIVDTITLTELYIEY